MPTQVPSLIDQIELCTTESSTIVFDELSPEIKKLITQYRSKDECAGMVFTSTDARIAINKAKKLRGSHYLETSIMTCGGIECPMYPTCPLYELKAHPEGERCPIEVRDFESWLDDVKDSIGGRLGLEPEDIDIVLLNSIAEIVVTNLLRRRAYAYVSNKGIITQKLSFVTPNGEQHFADSVNDAMLIIKELDKKVAGLYKQLLLTPEMNAKYKQKTKADSITEAGNLLKMSYNALKQVAQDVEELNTMNTEEMKQKAIIDATPTKT